MGDALASAQPGDVIDVAGGDWNTSADLDFDLTIRGQGPSTLLKCAGASPLVKASGGARVVLLDLQVEACTTESAVVVDSAEAYLERVKLKNTSTSVVLGTLLHVEGSSARAWVMDGKVDGLQTSGPAGVFSVNSGELTIQGGTYSSLQGFSLGRLVDVRAGALNLVNATVRDATTATHGMINITEGSTLKIDHSVFQNIQATNAVAVKSAGSSTLIIQDSLFTGLTASSGNGAVVYSWKSDDITLARNRFIGNSTGGNGGAFSTQQPTSFKSRRSLWCDNTSGSYAGAIYAGFDNGSHVEIDHDVFLQNQSASGGGAIRLYAASGTASVSPGISSSTFVMNQTENGALAHQIFGSSVTIDVSKTAFFQDQGGRHVLGNSSGTVRLYDGAYATTSTTIHFNGSIESGATAAVNDLNFVDRPNADCSNAYDLLQAETNGVLDIGKIGALLREDLDNDGHLSDVDCDDDDPEIHPEQDEQCDDIDHDCNGDPRTSATGTTIDLDDAWRDVDSDGYGDPDNPEIRTYCPGDFIPPGWVSRLASGSQSDCDDTDPLRNFDVEERCDDEGVDANCDGDPDAGATDTLDYFVDGDGDGIGDSNGSVKACDAPDLTSWSTVSGDCDDSDPSAFPDADELCDDVDHDCDGEWMVGAVDAPTWYLDSDSDGWGVDGETNQASCTQPTGFVAQADDCNDTNADVHPTAEELCDSLDRDCDEDPTSGATDALSLYTDDDGDGYGDQQTPPTDHCVNPGTGWSTNQDDCDDTNPNRFFGNVELCDTVDRDCDGDPTAGATDTTPLYPDNDGDGHGDQSAEATEHCEFPPNNWSASQDDCDDADSNRFFGNVELCDPIDRDCDGDPTAGATDTFLAFTDSDADGFGAEGTGVETCTLPDGASTIGTDCDDTNADIHPSATEACNDADDDCDLDIDEGCDADTADTADTSVLTPIPDNYIVLSGGCRTLPAPSRSWASLLVLGLLLRRRMR